MRAVSGSSSHTVWAPRAEVGVASLCMGLNFALCGLPRVSKPWDIGGFLPLAITVGVVFWVVWDLGGHEVTICGILGGSQRPYRRRPAGQRLSAGDLLRGQRPCRGKTASTSIAVDFQDDFGCVRLRACGVRRSGATMVVGST